VPAIEAYARWVIRHRWSVLTGVLLLTGILTLAATRLHVEVDPDAQVPQAHPYIQALNEVHRLFGDKNLIVVGLFPHDGNVFTPAFLTKLAQVTERLRKVPGANPALVQSLAAPQVKDIHGTADGLAVEPVMDEPPTDAAGAAAVRARAFANDAYVGTLVAKDGSAAAIQASFELTPQTPGYRQLHAAVVAALNEEADGTYDVELSGLVVFLSQLSAYASRMVYFFPLALVVIGLVHYDAFRTLQALFLPLATALMSVLWALGLMGLMHVSLDPFNTTTPILILAVAAGHAVQVLKRFYEEYDRVGDVHEAVVASLIRVGPVMLAAGTVAALSFCSLVTFGTATVRTFGLFTGFGIISAMAIEMTLIPAVRAMLPAPRRRELEREAAAHPFLDRLLRGATRASIDRPVAVVGVGFLLVLLCAGLAARVQVGQSVKGQFRASDQVRIEDAKINQHFSGTNTLILLVEGDGPESLTDPAILRAISRVQARLATEPGVGKVTSYVDFIEKMHKAMTADRPDAGTLPDTRELTAQYLLLYSMSGGGEDFDTIIDPTHRIATVRLLVHDDDTRVGQRLIDTADHLVHSIFPPGYTVRYTGTLASTSATNEVMVHGKLRNIVQIAVITIVISAILLRSLLAGLLVAVPLALAVAVNFGVMGLFDIPLDSMTAVISAMAVGIGADYAMYLLFRVREERVTSADLGEAVTRALATSGKAILFVSSAIAFGYATLCFSGFAVHVRLGSLVALAMLVSSAGALVMLPAIVMLIRPTFLERHAATPSLPALSDPTKRMHVVA
jgi:predicted RND superfamily exporter protein